MPMAQAFLDSPDSRSTRRKRPVDDVAQVARQVRRVRHAPERRFGAPAAGRFKRPPGAESGGDPRRNLWILRVEGEHRVGEKFVARPVGAVELGLIVLRKAADQGTYAV